jgi:ADP-ribose pyrophosphatase YjhB (NUDIX family)
MIKFENIHQLKEWLEASGVNLECWGRYEAKTIEDLWREISSGESQIQDDPPMRMIQVVNIILRSKDRILVEEKQQLGRNQNRYRGLPPAEKVKTGECHIDAAIRGLKEELQISPDSIKIVTSSFAPQISIHESQSYPGLRTQYTVHEVEVETDNLPDEDFWTNETNIDKPLVRHHWKWKSLEEKFG